MRCTKQIETMTVEVVTASYDSFEEYADHYISLQDRGYEVVTSKATPFSEEMTAMYKRVISKK